jgi:hypothetical protein
VNAVAASAIFSVLSASPQVSASPSSAPSPVVTALPAATTSAPTDGASSSPAPAPTTAPDTYKYRFVPRQPDHLEPGEPQIFAVYLNDKTLHSHGPIQIKVQTSSDVVKVVSESNGHQGVIPEIVPGDFEAFSTLPKVPFIASGMTLFLEFVATGPTGEKTTVRVPVKLL